MPGWKLAAGLGASVVALLMWFSGEVGVALAQGSAYGAEQRFPLKPPVPLVIPMVVSWTGFGGVGGRRGDAARKSACGSAAACS